MKISSLRILTLVSTFILGTILSLGQTHAVSISDLVISDDLEFPMLSNVCSIYSDSPNRSDYNNYKPSTIRCNKSTYQKLINYTIKSTNRLVKKYERKYPNITDRLHVIIQAINSAEQSRDNTNNTRRKIAYDVIRYQLYDHQLRMIIASNRQYDCAVDSDICLNGNSPTNNPSSNSDPDFYITNIQPNSNNSMLNITACMNG